MKVSARKQAAPAKAATSTNVPAVPGTRGEFRLGDLVWTPHNVRKTPRTAEDIRAMAASIHAHGGVMQNLLLVADMRDGQWTGKYGVAGGETRRLGCCYLRDGGIPEAAGWYTDDFMLPGLVVDAPEATAKSATENIQRTPLHPADEFEAFRELFDQCGSIEHVADFFAVSPLLVERRLRLANVSPKLFEVFRAGGMNIEQLMALCLVDDHRRQEAAWKAGETHSYMRQAHQLRQVLTDGKVSLRNHRVARFVGAEAYEAAGGHVMRDLFSAEANDGYLKDGELLQRLAAEKLDSIAATVRAEGWAWVETRIAFDYTEQSRYGRCEVRKRRLTAAEAKQLDELHKRAATARQQWELASENDDADPAEVDALERASSDLDAQIDAIESSRATVDASVKAIAGAVFCIDQSGNAVVHRGFIRAQDRKELKKAEKAKQKAKASARVASAGDDDAGVAADAASSSSEDVSRALKLRLGAQRTAALQVMVARDVPLALVTLAHSLAVKVLQEGYYGAHTLRITAHSVRDRLTGVDDGMRDSRAFTQMDALMVAWQERLPQENLFAWLRALPQDELLQLIAVCTAATINTVGDHALEASPLDGEAADMAVAAGLDMADWWEPTVSNYFGGVSKAQALDAVAEAVSKEAAAALAKLKKGELAAQAETLIAGRRWLPALLRKSPGVAQEKGE
jgi:ParB family chromosome partitioning protein